MAVHFRVRNLTSTIIMGTTRVGKLLPGVETLVNAPDVIEAAVREELRQMQRSGAVEYHEDTQESEEMDDKVVTEVIPVWADEDLPPPVDGVITLQDGYLYEVFSSVRLPDNVRLKISGTAILAGKLIRVGIEGNVEGPLVEILGVVKEITIRNDHPDGEDIFFDIENSPPGPAIIVDKISTRGTKTGRIAGRTTPDTSRSIVFRDCVFVNQQGLRISGRTTVLRLDKCSIVTARRGELGCVGIHVEDGSEITRLQFKGLEFPVENGRTGVCIGENVSITDFVIIGSDFRSLDQDPGVALEGIHPNDENMVVHSTKGILNSRSHGELSDTGSRQTVTIDSNGTWYPVGSETAMVAASRFFERVEVNGVSALRFTSLYPSSCVLSWLVSAQRVNGSGQPVYSVRIMQGRLEEGNLVDALEVPQAGAMTEFGSLGSSMSKTVIVAVFPGDVFWIEASRVSGRGNLQVMSCNLMIRE